MTEEEAVVQLRREMADRCPAGENGEIAEFIVLHVTSPADPTALVYDLMERAMAHTGIPGEGDNLKWEYAGWSCDIYYDMGGSNYTLCYLVGYYTTTRQEQTVDSAVHSLLSRLALEGRSDYQKVCAIYDYICGNVVYDYANLNDSSNLLKFTSYAALVDGTAVCQGYANLFYRLALEAGVDCRVIPGISSGQGHAWNIVELDGKFYNLDATWDAGLSRYRFFLRCGDNFSDHTRDPEYDTPQFHSLYPMDSRDFDPCFTGGHTWDGGQVTAAATCGANGVRTYTCVRCGESKTESIPATGNHFYAATGTTAPTCSAQGFTRYACSGCGATQTGGYTAELGHVWEDGSCTRCRVAYGEHFVDVPGNLYYFDTIRWAAVNGITTGTTDFTFEPDAPCTRAQVVTFLWRACGSRKPTATVNPFSDVREGSYYYDAVLWAVERGITNGVGDGLFGTELTCTRAQVATFLHRAAGTPGYASTENPFSDVKQDYYYDAVLWAAENGITNGDGDAHSFNPDGKCTRGQIVTFLYRAMA